MHPAMAAHGAPKRVLVLGGGDGLAVREVLKYPSVERVTLVELDPHMTALFRDNPKLAALNGHALTSPKLHIVNADAFGWLEQSAEHFDVIVIDFPTRPTSRWASSTRPASTPWSTSTSRRRLCRHPDHLALFARRSFWTVVTTVESVGLTTAPYHAHVPSFGEWGFTLASRRPFTPPRHLPEGLRFLSVQSLPTLFDFPPDMARVPTEVNRLSTSKCSFKHS